MASHFRYYNRARAPVLRFPAMLAEILSILPARLTESPAHAASAAFTRCTVLGPLPVIFAALRTL